ncbi:MAG TPA: threonine/serine dehydratase [Gaiellaceae bacterium]|nr:threonine/serine dehydratase [Gaiellaceae bacterium]
MTVTIDDVEAAARTIAGRVHRTPLLRSTTLGAYLKAELFQKTGAFKVRGALNKIAALSAEERARGVATVSAGNAGQAVAWAAREEGIDALIVTWRSADASKVAAMRGYGATVDDSAAGPSSAFDRLHAVLEETGRTLVHPFDDPLVIAGQGTIGLEIAEEGAVPDVVLCAAGGGGLVSGVAVAVKARNPAARVVAVEPEGSDALHAALEAGHPVPVTPRTAADALTGPFAGEHCFAICRELGVESVLVTEEELAEAFRFLYARTKLACELGAAAPAAAILAGKAGIEAGQTAVAVVSGGNVAPAQAAAILAGR